MEGQRSPSEIFEDLAEEIGGILQRPINTSLEEAPQNPNVSPNDHVQHTNKSERNEVVRHGSSGITRQKSVDSVDAMIEEEMLKPQPDPSSGPVQKTNTTNGHRSVRSVSSSLTQWINRIDLWFKRFLMNLLDYCRSLNSLRASLRFYQDSPRLRKLTDYHFSYRIFPQTDSQKNPESEFLDSLWFPKFHFAAVQPFLEFLR